MSLAAPVSEIEVRSSSPAIHAAWFEVSLQHLSAWNKILLCTEVSLYQYPFWNEPYRPLGITPRYLAWGTEACPLAFVTILTLGLAPAKIGLVFRGPTRMQDGELLSRAMISSLLSWVRAEGYMFVRFTHSEPEVLGQLAAAGHAEDIDACPYLLDYPITSNDYIVEQFEDDAGTLASFDREVRRKIRRATEAGYEFRSDDSPEALARSWPLYQQCARRKHFRLERPLSVYMENMRLAMAHNCGRLYSVCWNGKLVGSTLVFRDRTTAHCQLAAFDADHRGSAVFLHWHSMRDMYRLGARRYNLGPGPGSLGRFKQQFCEHPQTYPGPLTIVLKENWFRLWRRAVVPVAKQLRPVVRQIAYQRARLWAAMNA
jgi:hypothetical protein